jgi:hypothetical protein
MVRHYGIGADLHPAKPPHSLHLVGNAGLVGIVETKASVHAPACDMVEALAVIFQSWFSHSCNLLLGGLHQKTDQIPTHIKPFIFLISATFFGRTLFLNGRFIIKCLSSAIYEYTTFLKHPETDEEKRTAVAAEVAVLNGFKTITAPLAEKPARFYIIL